MATCTCSTRVTSGRKPALAEAIGATYHTGEISELRVESRHRCRVHGGGAVDSGCRRGRRGGGDRLPSPASAGLSYPIPSRPTTLMTDAVLKNLALFGSVDAERRHLLRAAQVLERADRSWLEQQLLTRRRSRGFRRGARGEPDDIEVAIEFPTA